MPPVTTFPTLRPPVPDETRGRPGGARLVRAGFIPLIDMAILAVAAECGFTDREGITLQLVKDVSWSNIRDRLAFRQFDVAHMLAPMPVASQLGLGSNPLPVFAPLALGRGGNAITLSLDLHREMVARTGLAADADALASARALKMVIDARRAAGKPPLVFAMTYPYSSHNYEFRFWMAAGGIHPDRDVMMTVVPPPLTADALAAGAIDGFCVNAPWNMIAVERGIGRVVATKSDLWPSAPEKVLGVRPDWADAHPDTLSRLIVALDGAARWCDVPDNRAHLAEILADERYIGTPADVLFRLLDGRFTIDPDGQVRQIPDYFVFHRDAANFPWESEALWIYSQMVRWGQTAFEPEHVTAAARAFRPDLYRAALGRSDTAIPLADRRIEGVDPVLIPTTRGDLHLTGDHFIDGRVFDPDAVADYVAGFAIRSETVARSAHF
ncbi:CmpA/NrtA family ABC transporter substrate-binding protein [Segnochrobactraceae bacterium EtOH-i3]